MRRIGDVITHRKLDGSWVIVNLESVCDGNRMYLHETSTRTYTATIRPISEDNQIGITEKKYFLSGNHKEDSLLEHTRVIRHVNLGYVVV